MFFKRFAAVVCVVGMSACSADDAPPNVPAELGQSCDMPAASGSEVSIESSAPECGASTSCLSVGPDHDDVAAIAGMCTCRCATSDGSAAECACGSGMRCVALIDALGLGNEDLAGSYCVPE